MGIGSQALRMTPVRVESDRVDMQTKGEIRLFRAEIHVHTVLSPCASVEMIPPLIVERALKMGIDMIAITDHNASANFKAVKHAAAGQDVVILPGMEVQTQEEVHVICLFDTPEQLAELQAIVDQTLPPIENNPEYFGEQFIVDETGDFLARESRLLIQSCLLSFEDIVDKTTKIGGIIFPAHVDRSAYGIFASLGFIPPKAPIDAVELSSRIKINDAVKRFPQIKRYPILRGGDVHHLDDFLGANTFYMAEPTMAEIRLALKGQYGRSVLVS